MSKKIHKTKSDKHSEYFDHKNSFAQHKVSKSISILPHPTTLESYEEISPGITAKLGNMIQKEQEHRHKIELSKVKSIHNVYRFGQLLSAMLAVIIIYATILMLEEYQDLYLAMTICVSGFTFLTIINIFSFKNKQTHKQHMHSSHHKKK